MSNATFQDQRFRFATANATANGSQVIWRLLKNCSVTPAQLGLLYASLCVVSLGIATMFWLQGAKMIMPFAWIELIAVGAAFLVYARHATDGERLVLQDGQLLVELSHAGKISREHFNREMVRVEPHIDDRSLIELSGQGRRVQVGRHVRPELRSHLARELRMALRAA
ncbi:DUF2244 domain-containing protein [Variovorax sp. PCZ-1]|uniref:DUF2244 domain-containing protein n=1 Tax=Variovorax sp. PCZ-1 TaxID=2835533 RepID=UPI001BCAFEAD|nr:DUF2244 domain-containing protein [Variovorax sp. PCZ-1]